MSSYYGVIFPEFWTGRTGRELRDLGGKNAQLLGLYLASNRHANMIGLYRLLVDDVVHETGLTKKSLVKAFNAAARSEYAVYDSATSFVWVRQMARIRLGLQPGVALSEGDLKVKAINRIYAGIEPNPFLFEFYQANHRLLRIEKRRESFGVVVPLSIDHKVSGLPSPSDAPSKPVTDSSYQGSESVQGSGSGGVLPERTPTRPAFERYHERFQARYGGKPEYNGGKDGKRMADLVKKRGLDEVLRRLDAFFASPDPWVQNSGHTLDVFFSAGTQTKLVAQLAGNSSISQRTSNLAKSSREFLQ